MTKADYGPMKPMTIEEAREADEKKRAEMDERARRYREALDAEEEGLGS